MVWRRIRAMILRKAGRKPRLGHEPTNQRVNRALKQIRATPEEIHESEQITIKALQRRVHNEQMGMRLNTSEDGVIQQTERDLTQLLGKRRAEKFFRLCNDPYF